MSGLSCGTRDLCCMMWELSLQRTDSLVVAHRLSCSTACGILVHQSGIEPMSPALQGRFFTIGPPGKSLFFFFFFLICIYLFGYARSWFRLVGSLVVACGIQFPDQRSNPGPMCWQLGVLAPGSLRSPRKDRLKRLAVISARLIWCELGALRPHNTTFLEALR